MSVSSNRHATLPGFGPGTHLMTTEGELPVEWLATGDRVVTRDHGAQPILWIGRVRLDADHGTAPVEIGQGALGPDCPTHPTWLAPAHRVLLSGAEVELHAGVGEALAPIATLTDGTHVRPAAPGPVCYTEVLLPVHDLVQANSLWAETLLLDDATRRAFQADLPPALLATPSLALGHARAARLCLTGWEVRAMRGRDLTQLPEMIRHVA
ncbi:MAG: Hint domain-containing protein [Pseudomonadota bacterium]|nr:Hint domain-containing protein [Pseudomonadota bacterium]